MYWYNWDFWFFHMWWFWIFNLIFYWLIIFAIIYFINSRKVEKWETALDILKKRYAKWEITKDEFEERKKDII